MASTVTRVSPFGQLLKQSKFSSFDSRIAQVYTTHGGDAHRGDWGFKRPLSIRRRGAFITVKNVDTPEYQTEWSSAEPQVLWMKNWDELQITPQWSRQVPSEEPRDHVQESDHLPNQQDPSAWRPPCVPNLDAMSREEFRKYLARIQAHRNRFYKETQAIRAKKGVSGLSFYQLSNSYALGWDELYAQYLSKRRRADPAQSGNRAPPTPTQGQVGGRVRWEGQEEAILRGVFCWNGRHRPEASRRPRAADERCPHRLPNVVGRVRQGLKATKMDMELKVSDGQSHVRSNPYPPGSRQYITAEPLDLISSGRKNMDNLAVRSKARFSPSTGVTLGILSNIIRKEDSS
ncbi:mitochondrial ribosomal protein subunit-domain-containing protein [Pisolithus croceorrhizus]|nr:mitochondrial ribosomal protein subunit-domain-containing protein [Pisolithus croceorrhizus]